MSDQKERKSLEDKYLTVEKAGKFIAGYIAAHDVWCVFFKFQMFLNSELLLTVEDAVS